MSLAGLYNATMTVQTVTRTRDEGGGIVEAWADDSTDNQCRIRLLTASERDYLGRQGIVTSHRMYCAADVDIDTEARITSGGNEYGVVAVDNPHGEGHHLQVDLIFRKGNQNAS